MNREFFLNALFLVLVNLLIKPFYVFGIERTIQDTVGASSYGLYATLFSFTFLLFIVNDFGIHYFNNRTIAQHPVLIGKYLQNILALKFLLTFLYLALVLLAALIRGFEKEIFHLIFFIAFNHILISLIAYLRSNISGLGMYRTDSLVSTLDKVILIILCGILLWGNVFQGDFQIEWFVYAQNISWLLTAIVAFLIIKKKIAQPLSFKIRLAFFIVVLKKSAPYALAVFLMTAYTRMDVVILEWMLPDGRFQAGVYAASYRLLDAFNIVGFLFAGLLLPMFATMLKKKAGVNKASVEIRSLLRLALQLIWAGAITLAVSCFFFRDEIMLWIYPLTATLYYGDVLACIILTLIPFSGIFIYSTLLTANGSLKKMNQLFVFGIVLNLALNLLLIPRYLAVGAGIAALSTQTFVLIGQIWIAQRELHLPTDWRQIGKITGFASLVVLAAWQLSQFEGIEWLLKFGISIAIGLLLAFIFRLINLRTLFALLKT